MQLWLIVFNLIFDATERLPSFGLPASYLVALATGGALNCLDISLLGIVILLPIGISENL